MTKAELRQYMRKTSVERQADPEKEAEGAMEFWRKVEASKEFRSADAILIFMAMPDEIPTREFIEKWRSSKRFAIPRVKGENLELKEYNPDFLSPGYKGIPEPTDEAADISPDEIDFALIPGTAFDRSGHRMGRGKGFYDRLLPQLHCPTMAVCQEWRIVDEVPTDPWDIRIDIIP